MYEDDFMIPFKIHGVNAGFTEVDGLLKIEKDRLSLEFESADAIIGIVKSDLKEVTIPFESIKKVEFVKKWFSAQIFIYTRNIAALKDVPGSKSGMVRLSIKRNQKREAMNFNSHLQLVLSEFKLKQLGD